MRVDAFPPPFAGDAASTSFEGEGVVVFVSRLFLVALLPSPACVWCCVSSLLDGAAFVRSLRGAAFVRLVHEVLLALLYWMVPFSRSCFPVLFLRGDGFHLLFRVVLFHTTATCLTDFAVVKCWDLSMTVILEVRSRSSQIECRANPFGPPNREHTVIQHSTRTHTPPNAIAITTTNMSPTQTVL